MDIIISISYFTDVCLIFIMTRKVVTNNQDIRPSVTVKASLANISWIAGQIHTIEFALESAP